MYAAIIIAIVLHYILNKTRVGLNLRAVGENPGTADAAGINVTKYKYLATCIGAGLSGIGGLYYVLDYNQGIWATTGQIEALGWLAVALVIFTTWKPLNAIWGAYLFGMLYWLYQFLPSILGIKVASYITDLIQMVPYVVTIVVLIVVSFRKKKENQPPGKSGTFLLPRGKIRDFWKSSVQMFLASAWGILLCTNPWNYVWQEGESQELTVCEKKVSSFKNVYKILQKCYIIFN